MMKMMAFEKKGLGNVVFENSGFGSSSLYLWLFTFGREKAMMRSFAVTLGDLINFWDWRQHT